MGLLNKGEYIMTNKMKDLIKRQNSPLSLLDGSHHFNDLFSMMHQLMDSAWNDWDLSGDAFYALQPKATLPKVNVSETDTSYEVEIAISGINKDELVLEFKDSCLFIKADKAEETEIEEKKWLRREISSRSVRRTIKFPTKIKSSAIESTYDESKGLVVCTLPKVGIEEPETTRIKIK